YLKAVKAAGTTDADKVMTELKRMKIDDMFTHGGYIRADGAMIHDMYVMQVKSPQESKYPWDYYKVVKKMAGEEAFGPITGLSPLGKKQCAAAAPEPSRGAAACAIPDSSSCHACVTQIFGIPVAVILGQLMLGLVNGSFYALLSLGLAVIFGLMGVVNFAHGAFYALGAVAALFGMQWFGLNYWGGLVLWPLGVWLFGLLFERVL